MLNYKHFGVLLLNDTHDRSTSTQLVLGRTWRRQMKTHRTDWTIGLSIEHLTMPGSWMFTRNRRDPTRYRSFNRAWSMNVYQKQTRPH